MKELKILAAELSPVIEIENLAIDLSKKMNFQVAARWSYLEILGKRDRITLSPHQARTILRDGKAGRLLADWLKRRMQD